LGVGVVHSDAKPDDVVSLHQPTDQEGVGAVLENAFVRVEVLKNGQIKSLWDKRAGREAVDSSAGGANKFIIFDDVPFFWDAWDTLIFHLQKTHPTYLDYQFKVLESGPLRATVEVQIRLSEQSRLEQRILLSATSPRLDFDTHVHWHENRRFLKVEFPVNVRSPVATYEIQFGHLQRATHSNTSWDMAKFEVCGHKWADLSEYGFGVAILNDNKYGYACQGNKLRLSLLRAPKQPDDHCDMGEHWFRYAMFPHVGSLQQGGVIAEAYRFNCGPILFPVGGGAAADAHQRQQPLFSIDCEAIVIETVKKAEDSNDIVLRLYEAFGGSAHGWLKSSIPGIKEVHFCNLLEEEEAHHGKRVPWNPATGVEIRLTPFQFTTVKLVL